jgi:murein DD-endopeptidase MepM/ murein hydrolase activator NlpD
MPPPGPGELPVVPSPGGNSLGTTASTSTVQTGTTGTAAPATVSTDPPADFTAAVNNALIFRLGITKFGLIPAKDKTALIAKIWQDPGIQTAYSTAGGRLATDPTISGQFGYLINNVVAGQGNDPTIAVDYTNMLQAAGVPLTTSEQASLASASQAVNAPVPKPFGSNVVSGYDFGQAPPPGGFAGTGPIPGWPTHMGVDYGTTAGDRIVSPFAGTVTVTHDQWNGNLVTVTLDNGWKMGFGHVASGAATNGARVNPGDLIAISGANVGDSKGSVTLVTWQDPQGKYVNPHDALDPIFAGTTFSTLGAPGAAGTGYPTVNAKLDAEYPSIGADWKTYFGSPPSPEDVFNVISHGTSPIQWQDYIRSMPSHIAGLNQGQALDTRQAADAVSMKDLGHPATDGIVKELHDAGTTSAQDIQDWYGWNSPDQIDKATYQKIVKAVKPITSGIFNDTGADPRDIKTIHDNMVAKSGPVPI